jgi:alcohol dehydrogenase (NADP+)
LDWAGKAFPYLLHHPKDPKATDSYRKVHSEEADFKSEPARGNTGTWNGPAPRGYDPVPRHVASEPYVPAKITNEPKELMVRGGGRLPLLGLGTYKLDSADAVVAAFKAGYRHIDCAPIYGNEDVVGKGIKSWCESMSLSNDNSTDTARSSLWITSKIWNDAHRAPAVKASIEKSIADLQCAYLDLALVHWPDAWIPGTEMPDPEASLRETWQALEAAVDAGLVRHLGVSNFGLKALEGLLSWARIKPVVNQIELHPLLSQRKLVGVSARYGVHCVAYSPLGHSKTDLLEHPTILRVAQETGKTAAQVLLRWAVQRGTAVIPKAGSEPHVLENIDGLFEWRLTWDQKSSIDALDAGKRFISPSWHEWEDEEEGGAAKPSTVLLL